MESAGNLRVMARCFHGLTQFPDPQLPPGTEPGLGHGSCCPASEVGWGTALLQSTGPREGDWPKPWEGLVGGGSLDRGAHCPPSESTGPNYSTHCLHLPGTARGSSPMGEANSIPGHPVLFISPLVWPLPSLPPSPTPGLCPPNPVCGFGAAPVARCTLSSRAMGVWMALGPSSLDCLGSHRVAVPTVPPRRLPGATTG